jgi:site-specific recombinase XerC
MGKNNHTDTLVMQAIRIVKKIRIGSYKTRHNHLREASRFVQTIREMGYGVNRWKNISNKHVQQAVNRWKENGLQVATIKEYLSGVRTICRLYGNDRILEENSGFGIGPRIMVDNKDKSLPQVIFESVVQKLKESSNKDDHRVAAQLQLERYLGLRAEESSKFVSERALLADGRVFIQDGTKGGRERMIHGVSPKALEAIKYAKDVAGKGNLIPYHSSEKQWVQKYYRIVRQNGISRKACGASSHGLRHAYAQERYREITGFAPPCKFESKEEFRQAAENTAGKRWRKLNQDARQILKAELGHGPDRDDVVSQYLGAI